MFRTRRISLTINLGATLAITAACVAAGESDPVTELEDFIITETRDHREGGTMPDSRPFLSAFGEQSLLDVPRSATILTPELMEHAGIEDFSDLDLIGAGTQQINYYGVPGTPTLRGARGGVFYLGVQRAYQRNEMPLSFGAVEAMDIVKGPAPAHLGAAQVGGYVNLVPKTPYFDRSRGSVAATVGSYNTYRVQLDAGGPFLLGPKPSAWRVSITAQQADSYYDRIGNDFVSIYAALKTRLSKDTSVFTGGEYFKFKSNENAGWNRPTQELIDNGRYVIGEPISIVSERWGGVANRDLLYRNAALVVPVDIVDAAVAAGEISTAQREAMLNLADPNDRAEAYANFTPEEYAEIDPSTSGYQYTPAYFEAGGSVFTTQIDANQILSDAADHADSENLLWFLEVESTANAERTLRSQLLVDHVSTDKLSTYGYAIQTEQTVIEAKFSAEERVDFLGEMKATYGVSARYTDAKMLQDFFDEPFSRRDVSRSEVSANSTIPAGPQTDPDGTNFWSPTSHGGANAHSRLWQLSAFGYAENRFSAALKTYTSVLVAHAPYTTRYPDEVDRIPPDDPRRNSVSDSRNYYSLSFSPVVSIFQGLNVYGTLQYGTALDPLQGGAIAGKENFARNQLWEVGAKYSAKDGQIFLSAAAYGWEQTQFDDRANRAELLRGKGVEFEAAWRPSTNLTLIGSVGYQKAKRLGDLGFRSVPLTEEQFALQGGVLNHNFSGIPPQPGFGPYSRPESNPDLEYPGTPRTQAKLLAIVHLTENLGISGGPIWSSSYWHNFDQSLRLPSVVEWNAMLFFRTTRWDITLRIDDLTGSDSFSGAEPVFGANTIITKGSDTHWELTATWRF